MKPLITIFLFTILAFNVTAQKLTAYQASNGIVYHIKDPVHLGRGSAPDGTFLYLQIGGWAVAFNDSSADPNVNNVGRSYANTAVIVKKIAQVMIKGVVKTYFTVGGGNITNYLLSIEDAIQVCEVVPCTANNSNQPVVADKFDQLKKLKALFDSGALTQAEYDDQKKKLLNQ